jgi:cbb3-type cytochrome oxidase maturation protein
MEILYLMIICSVSLAVIFLIIFIIGAKKGQFEDDESPAVRILFEDEVKSEEEKKTLRNKTKKKLLFVDMETQKFSYDNGIVRAFLIATVVFGLVGFLLGLTAALLLFLS